MITGFQDSGDRLVRSALAVALGAALFLRLTAPAVASVVSAPIEVRVVVVTTWETVKDGRDGNGELHHWLTRWPLKTELPFATGPAPLHYDPQTHLLAVLTGMATARAAASITALGMDPRFDLSHAYWIVAGTAGVDPKAASVGSAAWARWVVDGDLAQELDSRDAPASWTTGIVPYGRSTPYQAPAPPGQSNDANVAYALNPQLVTWAFQATRGVGLPDDAVLARLRAPYTGPGHGPPVVLQGEGLMSARTWYGETLNDWAERWVSYWTKGQGIFVMSAEEDTGILQALTQLAQDHRVDLNRVLVLRAASDYTVPPSGMSAADFLKKETSDGFPADQEALDALFAIASPIARRLTNDWSITRDHIPAVAP